MCTVTHSALGLPMTLFNNSLRDIMPAVASLVSPWQLRIFPPTSIITLCVSFLEGHADHDIIARTTFFYFGTRLKSTSDMRSVPYASLMSCTFIPSS